MSPVVLRPTVGGGWCHQISVKVDETEMNRRSLTAGGIE